MGRYWIAASNAVALGLGFGLGMMGKVSNVAKVCVCSEKLVPPEQETPETQETQKQIANPIYPVYPSFNMDQPQGRTVDVNIGTNFSPMPKTEGNSLLLVDPLPVVCSHLSKQATSDVAVLCCAVSNYTGSSTFKVYNNQGVSSSLAEPTAGTSHGRFKQPRQILTVIVLEASALLGGLIAKQNRIQKLKTDMQGFDLTALMNLRPILSDKEQILQIKSECFYTNSAGKQIYHADNDCQKMVDYLTELGYMAVAKEETKEYGSVFAYKPPATDFGDAKAFGN